MKTYHVYIMASASRVLYIGVTSDLLRRIREHKEGKVSGFTARYCVTELVYFEAFGDIRVAIAREKQLKGWLRSRKIALIESLNPRWKDLSAELQKPNPRQEPREILRFAQNDKPATRRSARRGGLCYPILINGPKAHP